MKMNKLLIKLIKEKKSAVFASKMMWSESMNQQKIMQWSIFKLLLYNQTL